MKLIRLHSLLFLGLWLSVLHAQEITVKSEFEPNIIREEESALYYVSLISTAGDPAVESLNMPNIEGLEFQYVGPRSSQSMNLTNQGFSRRLEQSYIFRVRASKAGEFTVPAFPIKVAGKQYIVPEAKLKVLDGQKAASSSEGPSIWTELELPRESIYVGEAVRATIKLIYDPKRIASIDSRRSDKLFVVKEGDAFTISNYGRQSSKDIEREGRILREVSWPVVLTPLKTSSQPIVLQSDWQIATSDGATTRRYRSPLDSFFGGGYRYQNITLYTDDEEFNVLPLPREGQPVDFTGGIGKFTVDQPRISANQAMAGEPLTLTLAVNGQGNFGRMQPPALAESDVWRSYPPEEQFQARDQLGDIGTKYFEYTLIPREAGELSTPEIHFNFFDPESAKYIELPIPGQSINVKVNPNAQRPQQRNPVTARRGPELLPIAASPGAWVSAIKPVIANPFFLGAQLIPAFMIGLVFIRRRHELRLENDPAYARRIQASKQLKIEMDAARKAANDKKAADFYAAAQRAVQCAAGSKVKQTPESLTLADIEAIAKRQQLSNEQIESARQFLEAGDAVRFGGIDRNQVDFNAELARLESVTNAFGGKR